MYPIPFLDFDFCETKPCKNGGTCKDKGKKNDFECTCRPGFTGTYCEKGELTLCVLKTLRKRFNDTNHT